MLRTFIKYLKRFATQVQPRTRSGGTRRFSASLHVEQLEDRVTPSGLSFPIPSLPKEMAGQSYSAALHATGGDGNYLFSPTAGSLPAGISLSNSGVLSGTATVAGSYSFTVTVTDPTSNVSSVAAVCSLYVIPGAVTSFAVGAPSAVTAGARFSVTITPQDAYGNTVTNFSGGESLFASDGETVHPAANLVVHNGVATATVYLTIESTLNLIAVWGTTSASPHGISGPLTVTGGTATSFVVSEPTTATAGAGFNVAITAKDAFGNLAANYSGSAVLTASDGQIVHLTAAPTFINGVATPTVTLNTAHTLKLTAISGTLHGIGGAIAVQSGTASAFTVSEPSTAAAGANFTVTITAKDSYGNIANTFSGPVVLTSSDSQTVYLVATPTFRNGIANAVVSLHTVDTLTLTATSGNIQGTGGNIAVHAGAASSFVVGQPDTVTAGAAFTVTMTPKDAFGNTVLGFTGGESLAASDGQTIHPAANLVYNSGGSVATIYLTLAHTLTFTATSGSIHGTSGTLTVIGGAASSFVVSEPTNATAGTPFNVTTTAKDVYGNTATGYSGGETMTASDGQTVSLAATPTFSNGVAIAAATLNTPHTLTLTATSGAIHGTGGSTVVSASAVSSFVVSEPSTATAGTSFTVTITAKDASGNTLTGFGGSVVLTASDSQTVYLPTAPVFVNGVATATVTLNSADSLTLTATSGTVHGTGGSIAVAPAAASTFVVGEPSSVTAGTSFTVTITAKDSYGNTVTGFSGNVTITGSDAQTVHLAAAPTFTNGVATATVSLNTADSLTLTATSGSVQGIGGSIAVAPAAASTFIVSEPSSATAGTSFTVTITAKDTYGNTVTGFSGNVALTGSDAQTVHLAANPTFTNGVATATVTLNTADTLTLTATSGTILGTGGNITVTPASATTFVVSEPSTATAGTNFTVTITAKDTNGNTVTGFSGNVALTGSDSQTVHLAANPTFTNGVATATVTLNAADSLTLTATSGSVHGTGGAISVAPATATTFVVSEPSTATAGTSFTVTITARDTYGNSVTGFNGSVALTGSDAQTVHLAASPTFSNGVATATVTLNTADTLALTATSGTVQGTGGSIIVAPASASSFIVSEPSTATAGTSFTVTITTKDSYGNTVTGFNGSVALTGSDGQTVHLAANPTFTNGVATASVTLNTADSLTLTATSGTVHGTGGAISVAPASASTFVVSEPASATAGTSFTVTITTKDTYGNTVIGFNGTVALTGSDAQTVHLAANPTFTNGVATATVTLNAADTLTLTATSGTVHGTGGAISVAPATATTFVVSEPSTATAGTSFTVSITAKDAYGNIVTGFNGTVAVTGSDAQTVHLAATPTFINGVATATVTLNTTDALTLTATSGTVQGTGGIITVAPASATTFVVSEPSTATAGTSFTVTITAKDANGNTVTGFGGSVTLTGSDAQTIHLAATPAFTNGVATATVTLNTADTLTLTATSGTVQGIGGSISVAPAATASFIVSEPSTATAGTSFTVSITAKDAFGNTVTGFNGSVALTGSDAQTVHLAANPTFTNGVATATVTLNTADTLTLTATSGTILGTGGNITVAPASASTFIVSEPSTATAGTSFTVSITAKDANGNTVTGFSGSVALTGSDAQTVHVAANPTFTNGVATATVTLNTADTLTLTATSGSVHGAGGAITVAPAAASTFIVGEPSSATAGTSFTVTITANDAYGNTVTSYAGNVTLTGSDGQTVSVAATPVFANGVAAATVTLNVADTLTLTATAGAVHGTGGNIAVAPGAASTFVVSEPSTATVGASFTVTITANDAYGNTVTSFSGSVTLTSSDGQTVQVASTPTFTNGVATATVTLNTAGTPTLTATSGSIQGVSGTITVTSVVVSDWFSLNMPDASLQNLARTDFTGDGGLSYSDLLGLFSQAEGGGSVTSTELQSLQALVTASGATAVNMDGSVKSLAYKVIDGDPANTYYQGAALGNLAAGSSATQLQNLVNKWFLGEDHPTIDTTYISGSATYQLASGTLFGSSGPSYQDVRQGEEGDCWLLASAGVTAAHDPSIIQSMFTDDGTTVESGVTVHVWTVRFYNNGVATYLTVDNKLPAIGTTFAYANLGQSLSSSTNVLWVPLLEKAYAQLSASGWNQRPQANAYASINSGVASTGLPIITGGTELNTYVMSSQSAYVAAINAGDLLTLSSSYSGNSTLGIVASHDYVVLGYNSTTQTFSLLNPWGWNVGGSDPGILNLTWAQITANFSQDGICTP